MELRSIRGGAWFAPRFWNTPVHIKQSLQEQKKTETSRFYECDLATPNNSCNIFRYYLLPRNSSMSSKHLKTQSFISAVIPPTCWQAALECWEWSPQQTHLLEVHLSNKPLGHTVWIQSTLVGKSDGWKGRDSLSQTLKCVLPGRD